MIKEMSMWRNLFRENNVKTLNQAVAVGKVRYVINLSETLHDHRYAELANGTVVFNLLYHSQTPPSALLAKGCSLVTHIFPKDCAAVRADVLGRISNHDLSHIVKLLKEIRREENTKRPLGHDICTALFTAVVLLLARATEPAGADASDDLPFRRAIDFIEQNFSRKIVIGELCEISGLSASTLHRTFRRITGRSPGDYLIDVRVAKAKTLLMQPGATLGTVAHQTGFCGASHLSRTLSARRL